MSWLLILKSDRICVSVPAVGWALLLNRPTVRQENKGKFGGWEGKHVTHNLLSSVDDFLGFTDRYWVGRPSAKWRHTVGWLYSDWEHLHVGRQALMFVRSSGRTEAWHDASALTLAEENVRRWRCRPSCWVEQLIQRRPLLGQYEPPMNGLMRETHGNFKRFYEYQRICSLCFSRVSPWIT